MEKKNGKQALLQAIEELIPLFEYRKVYTSTPDRQNLTLQNHWLAIHEKGSEQAISFVSPRYRLIQLRDSFLKAIDKLEDIEGTVYYYRGKGMIEIFPTGEQYGIVISNSVDRSLALKVEYATRHNGFTFIIPKKLVQGFKKKHIGKAEIAYEDFLEVITSVKEAWKSIVEKLSNQKLGENGLELLLRAIHAGKRTRKRIEERTSLGPESSFWEGILECIRAITDRQYKSAWHKKKKLYMLSSVLLSAAFLAEV